MKDHLSIEQLILLEVYKKEKEPTTIDELVRSINAPRTTLVEHLNLLARDGFLTIGKEGRVKQYWPREEIREEFSNALSRLTAAYVSALDKIRSQELKELKKHSKTIEEKNADEN